MKDIARKKTRKVRKGKEQNEYEKKQRKKNKYERKRKKMFCFLCYFTSKIRQNWQNIQHKATVGTIDVDKQKKSFLQK